MILTLISALILVSGCTNSGNQTSSNSNNTKTYSVDNITFQYPEKWVTLASQARNSVVAVGDPNTNDGNGNARVNVVIQKTVQPQNETFLEYFNDTYTNFASQNLGFEQISQGTILINGLNGYETVYKINSGEIKEHRAVWIQENDNIYIILCTAPESDYNIEQSNFDIIVNSFKIQ